MIVQSMFDPVYVVWSGLVWSGKFSCKSYRTGTVLGGRCATDGVGGARSMSMA